MNHLKSNYDYNTDDEDVYEVDYSHPFDYLEPSELYESAEDITTSNILYIPYPLHKKKVAFSGKIHEIGLIYGNGMTSLDLKTSKVKLDYKLFLEISNYLQTKLKHKGNCTFYTKPEHLIELISNKFPYLSIIYTF
jgi:hypothetical protein